jgi:ABC-type transport system substrate-binding protein
MWYRICCQFDIVRLFFYHKKNMKLSRWHMFALCTSLILISVFSFSDSGGNYHAEKPVYGGVFRIKSFADEFTMQLDPAQPESYIFLSEQLFDGLVRLDKNLKIIPSLADYWMISSDGKTYTFILKKGVRFHNGEELTASDVKFSLERLLNRDVNSPYYTFFLSRIVGAQEYREGESEQVAGIKVLDRYTIEIKWTRPYVSALYLLSMHFCKILPRESVLRHGRGFFMKPIGTGPFQFDYWVRDTRLNEVGVRLKRNEDYFIERPYLDALEFCPLYNLDHFMNGQIDSIPVLSERLLGSKYQIFKDGSLQQVFLGMSCHIFPLNNPMIRRAILAAINKQAVVEEVDEARYLRRTANRYIPFKIPGFFYADESETFDLEKAERLLKAAGFSAADDFPTLTLYLDLPRTSFKNKLYRELRDQLSVLDIDLRVDYYRRLDEVKESKSPYLILIQRLMSMPDPEDMIRPLFSSKSATNVLEYTNPQIDELLQAGEVEKSWTRRIKIFRHIEDILLEEVPAIPLYSQQNLVAMQPDVRGVEVPPMGFYYLEVRKIWLEE